MIKNNLQSIKQRMERAAIRAGRAAEDVTLVCVTKEVGAAQAMDAIEAGVRDIGENRVQEALKKHRTIGKVSGVRWHLIGHLQSNKVRDAVELFDLIHSVDSLKLAQRIDGEARAIDKRQDILIQVNVSAESTKFGINPEETLRFVEELMEYPNIALKGLMAIAPFVPNSEEVRPYFRQLRELREEIRRSFHSLSSDFELLSMGMSGDFETAIEEGANIVRIGSAVFKDRHREKRK